MNSLSINLSFPLTDDDKTLLSTLMGSGAASAPSTPAPSPLGDGNTYPFIQPSDFAAGGTWEAGNGLDTLQLALSSSPGVTQDCTVSISVNGKGIAYPVSVKARVGQNVQGCDNLIFHGPWGPSPTVTIAGVPPGGNNALWVMSVLCDGAPLVANGMFDSRGGQSVNGSWVFATNGAPVVFGPPVAVAPAPAAPALLPPLVPALTADYIGLGETTDIVDASGHRLTFDKAILVPSVAGLTISNVGLKNATIGAALGLNGAGVRDSASGIGFTLKNVEISGCQNGILTFDSQITVDSCNIHDNGEVTKPGNTHNLYVGGNPTSVFKITNTKTANCRDAHEVKSRAGTTISDGCTHVTGGNGSGYDIPDAGLANISNGSITLPANAQDRNFITYAMESTKNSATGMVVTITNQKFIDLTGQGGFIQAKAGTGATLNLVNCIYSGLTTPQLVGWAKIIGTIAKAAG